MTTVCMSGSRALLSAHILGVKQNTEHSRPRPASTSHRLLVPCTRCTSGPRFSSPRHTSCEGRTTSLSRTLKAGAGLGGQLCPPTPRRHPDNVNNPQDPARGLVPAAQMPAREPCLWPDLGGVGAGEAGNWAVGTEGVGSWVGWELGEVGTRWGGDWVGCRAGSHLIWLPRASEKAAGNMVTARTWDGPAWGHMTTVQSGARVAPQRPCARRVDLSWGGRLGLRGGLCLPRAADNEGGPFPSAGVQPREPAPGASRQPCPGLRLPGMGARTQQTHWARLKLSASATALDEPPSPSLSPLGHHLPSVLPQGSA